MKLLFKHKKLQIIAIILTSFISSLPCFGDDVLTITPISTTCHNSQDGVLEITLNQNELKVNLLVSEDSLFQSSIYNNIITDKATIEKLKANIYYVKYSFNDKTIINQIQITEPKKLEPGIIKIEKGLNNINDTDAILVASPIGGTKPYTFKWSENTGTQKTQKAFNLGQGTYYCEIDDVNNCGPVRTTIFFNHITYPEKIKK